MLVHLCRHAEAAPGEPDHLRPLTTAGVVGAETLAQRLAGTGLTAILTSPLLRARQTAEIVGSALAIPVLVDTRLAPGATVASLEAALDGLVGPVATIGHQPDCSEIAAGVTGESIPFGPAASACLELNAGPR
jgi:phosphohistidine phosphatase